MVERIDVRGSGCTEPLLRARKALETVDQVIILLDDMSALQNLRTWSAYSGHQISITEEGKGLFSLYIRKTGRERDS